MSDQPPHDPALHESGTRASPEHRRRSFEIEDRRWALAWQTRDWALLLAAMLVTLGWTAFVYLLEPGLR